MVVRAPVAASAAASRYSRRVALLAGVAVIALGGAPAAAQAPQGGTVAHGSA
jgi:hypothetical protein